MSNKTPRHEMVNGKAAFVNFPASKDAADIAANLDDIIPEPALLGERCSLGWSREFVGDVWNVRGSCLQEQRKIPVYEVRQDAVVILKVLTPYGVDGDAELRLCFSDGVYAAILIALAAFDYISITCVFDSETEEAIRNVQRQRFEQVLYRGFVETCREASDDILFSCVHGKGCLPLKFGNDLL